MKKYNIILSALVAAVGMLMSACSDEKDPGANVPTKLVPIELSRSEAEIVSSQNGFSFDMFQKLAAENERGNFMASPLSVSMVMSMLANGTAGDTRDEILNTLGFEEKELADVNAFNRRLAKDLAEVDRTTKVSLANSIWIDNSLKVYDSFISVNKETYGADIFNVNLSAEETRKDINKWASDKTNGMIPEFLKRAPGGLACLMNALYFNGKWVNKFDKTLTAEGDFHNADGTLSHPMMMKAPERSFAGFYDDKGASWVEICYGNLAYRLVLVLPDEGVALSDYLATLTKEEWQEYNGYYPKYQYKGSITFPKFTMENELELSEVLAQLGIKKVFMSDVADFSLMTSQEMAVSQVKQATKVRFDEEGTEAAAVTAVMVNTDPGPLANMNLVFDRPFAFIIQESSSKTILFTGCVNKL